VSLFNRPGWMRPKDVNKPLYWLHIAIIAVSAQLILNYFGYDVGGVFTVHTLYFAIIVAFVDIKAHSLLKID